MPSSALTPWREIRVEVEKIRNRFQALLAQMEEYRQELVDNGVRLYGLDLAYARIAYTDDELTKTKRQIRTCESTVTFMISHESVISGMTRREAAKDIVSMRKTLDIHKSMTSMMGPTEEFFKVVNANKGSRFYWGTMPAAAAPAAVPGLLSVIPLKP
jgi:uncharacterized protein with PhoU and TrkA domain